MKSNLLAVIWFVITFSLSSSVAGQKCDTEIREGHIAGDLSKALTCINERIRKLEDATIKGGEKPDDNRGASYTTGSLTVSVRGASKDKDKIYIGLDMQNKTTEPFFIALEHGKPPVLVEYRSGKPKTNHSQEFIRAASTSDTNNQYYTPIPINGSLTPSFIFYSDNTTETAFTLNLALLRFKNGNAERIPVSLKVVTE